MQRSIGCVVFLSVIMALYTGCTTTGSSSVSTQDFFKSTEEGPSRISELAPGDTIEISVEVDGLMEVVSHRAALNHQGLVTLPLVGDVKVGGCTLDKAQDVIAKTYGSYYVRPPVVMISLVDNPKDGEWGYVTVMGRVGRPGRMPLHNPNGMNLTEAIQDAGGLSESAKKTGIRVTRKDAKGKPVQTIVNFDEIGLGNTDVDIKLIDGDVVYVPERIF
ncbi:MAG: polysaccharide export protein [Kiritimatiellales bacterium]|nr:polysaccharide export protein [Kiritimatiellales bacterium]